jgi:hypothetical protein
MEYLISGSGYGIDCFCVFCVCKTQEVCIPKSCNKTEPCTCESDFCGAEVCYPVKMEPLNKKRNL